MDENVGGFDRIVRVLLGVTLIAVGTSGSMGLLELAVGPLPQTVASGVVILVGGALLVTGLLRRCPINAALGISSFRNIEE